MADSRRRKSASVSVATALACSRFFPVEDDSPHRSLVNERTPARDADAATVRRRGLAYVADTIVVLGAVVAAERRRGSGSGRRILRAGLLAGVGGTLYHVLLEGAFGRTVGKRLLGIAVIRSDGAPCTYTAATTRTLLRAVDWLPVAYLLGLAAIRLTERRRRIGDRLAGTVVVRPAGE